MAELVMLDVPSNLGTELMAPPVVVVTGALCAPERCQEHGSARNRQIFLVIDLFLNRINLLFFLCYVWSALLHSKRALVSSEHASTYRTSSSRQTLTSGSTIFPLHVE
jgi:hypothetical protein